MLFDLPQGTTDNIILAFTWPEGDTGHADGLAFYGALFDPATGDLVSNYDTEVFSY